MHFSLTGQYTPQALRLLIEDSGNFGGSPIFRQLSVKHCA